MQPIAPSNRGLENLKNLGKRESNILQTSSSFAFSAKAKMVQYYFTDCKWLPANHFLFQLANICLVFSYLVPDTMNGLFLLRFWLGSAGLFFGLWGWFILCAPDTFGWNVVFMFFNYAHFIYLLIKVKRPRKFSPECEIVFKELFEPLGVQRYQFHTLASKTSVLRLEAGENFAEEDSLADRISILLSGSVEVIKDKQILHITRPFEFLNSPEYAAGESGETAKYGVTLAVRENITCLSWENETLRKMLKKDRFLTNVFNALIGQDVTKKLLRISDNLTDLRAEDISKYRTGSIVYMHSTATDLAVYTDGHAHMVCSDEMVLINSHTPPTRRTPPRRDSSPKHKPPQTPESPPLIVPQPVLDISQIGAGLRHDSYAYDDNQALIRSSSVSPQTPPASSQAQLQKVAKSLPVSWSENTPLATAAVGLNVIDKETVL